MYLRSVHVCCSNTGLDLNLHYCVALCGSYWVSWLCVNPEFKSKVVNKSNIIIINNLTCRSRSLFTLPVWPSLKCPGTALDSYWLPVSSDLRDIRGVYRFVGLWRAQGQVLHWLAVFWLAALRADLTAGRRSVLNDESVWFGKGCSSRSGWKTDDVVKITLCGGWRTCECRERHWKSGHGATVLTVLDQPNSRGVVPPGLFLFSSVLAVSISFCTHLTQSDKLLSALYFVQNPFFLPISFILLWHGPLLLCFVLLSFLQFHQNIVFFVVLLYPPITLGGIIDSDVR